MEGVCTTLRHTYTTHRPIAIAQSFPPRVASLSYILYTDNSSRSKCRSVTLCSTRSGAAAGQVVVQVHGRAQHVGDGRDLETRAEDAVTPHDVWVGLTRLGCAQRAAQIKDIYKDIYVVEAAPHPTLEGAGRKVDFSLVTKVGLSPRHSLCALRRVCQGCSAS